MATNPYSPCPCGSGKKFKFCCQDVIADLQRIPGLARNQPEVALAQVQALAQKHPNRESVIRELVVLLLNFGRVDEATQACIQFLKANPDHPSILLIYADISLQRSGFEAARRIVHRAFQVSVRQFPREVGMLLARVGKEMFSRGSILAAREHLLLASRLHGAEEPSPAISALKQIEVDQGIPYLARVQWTLLNIDGPPEVVQQHERALRLCRLGCWEPASIIYNRLADQMPGNSAVWYNLGLCQMWDGRDAEASSSLHHSAVLSTDFEHAAEAEALSQTLVPRTAENSHSIVSIQLEVRSASELVARLRDHSCIREQNSHDHSECSHHPGTHHAAEFNLGDRPSPAAADITADNVARYLADIDVHDIVDTAEAAEANLQNPLLEVTCASELVDQVLVTLRDIAGDLIISGPSDEKRSIVRSYPSFARSLERRFIQPPDCRDAEFSKILPELNRRAIDAYLAEPQPVLAGKSMLEAADDPNLRKQLAGAIYFLQAYAATGDVSVDVDELRSRLKLPPCTPLAASEAPQPSIVSLLTVSRLAPADISSDELPLITQFFISAGIRLKIIPLLDEMIRRGLPLYGIPPESTFLIRASIARAESDRDLAFSLLEQAREFVSSRPDVFRLKLELDIRELAWRLDFPEDPQIVPLLHRLRDQYLRKIPELAELIEEQLTEAGCERFLPEIQLAAAPPQSSLWTPGAQQPAQPAGSLWIPGQR
jgi:Flp pilus assembly protein TadD